MQTITVRGATGHAPRDHDGVRRNLGQPYGLLTLVSAAADEQSHCEERGPPSEMHPKTLGRDARTCITKLVRHTPICARRARLPQLWRLLPYRNGRPHLDPARRPHTLARDGAERHRGRGAAGALRHDGICHARRRLVRAPRNLGQSQCMPSLRSPGHDVPGLREGKLSVPRVP